MTICADGHKLTAADIEAGVHKVEKVVAEIKDEGYLPPNATVKLDPNMFGVAGVHPTNISPVVEWAPQYAACMSEPSVKAVTLHETGHLHEGFFIKNGEMALGIVNVALFVLAGQLLIKRAGFELGKNKKLKNMSDYAARDFRKRIAKGTAKAENMPTMDEIRVEAKQELKRRRPKLRKAAALLAAWAVGGLALTESLRANEINADLYAAYAMGTPTPKQNALVEGAGVQDGFDLPKESEFSQNIWLTLGVGLGYLGVQFMREGPAVFFISDHPSDEDRIKRLEQERPKIAAAVAARQQAQRQMLQHKTAG